MRTVRLFITAVVVSAFGLAATAQTHDHMNMNMATSKTETFKVLGNCDMCKTRIENAVKEEGASSADWSTETKLLTVTFDPSKTNVEALSKKLAGVGHDTEKFKADDKVYDALPACCKYERTTIKMQADYTCPMHPDVHSDKPGKCPECGMDLVKKEIAKPDAVKTAHSME